MPPDSHVGISHHDNNENEIAGVVAFVRAFDPETSDEPEANRKIFVVLYC
jgi:hypothetical protein